MKQSVSQSIKTIQFTFFPIMDSRNCKIACMAIISTDAHQPFIQLTFILYYIVIIEAVLSRGIVFVTLIKKSKQMFTWK